MKRRSLLLIASLLLLSPQATIAQPPAFDNLEKASIRLLEWFRSLSVPLDAIVATERKAQLYEALSNFSNDLYVIELDKSMLIQLLKRDHLNRDDIYNRTGQLMRSIDRARESLRNVGPLLRSQHAIGGIEVETLLSEAALTRKVWVSELYEADPSIPTRDTAVADGERALNALRAANTELAKLLTRLR